MSVMEALRCICELTSRRALLISSTSALPSSSTLTSRTSAFWLISRRAAPTISAMRWIAFSWTTILSSSASNPGLDSRCFLTSSASALPSNAFTTSSLRAEWERRSSTLAISFFLSSIISLVSLTTPSTLISIIRWHSSFVTLRSTSACRSSILPCIACMCFSTLCLNASNSSLSAFCVSSAAVSPALALPRSASCTSCLSGFCSRS
mmetsp:Transcript_16138/g.40701  ORF Transcript_16138/g.40701 Transcript_16138/m.40701 type:complete len:207 (+) Transcript_16138:550-1170(+)